MYSVETTVTPELARKFLEKNTKNRKIDWRKVKSYADMMKSGAWQKNPEGISFYENGTLRNGQHRLYAVIEADTPVEMVVFYDVPNESVICDNQKIRTLQNFCELEEMPKALCTKIVTAGVNTIFTQYSRSPVGDAMRVRFIEDNADRLTAVYKMTNRGDSKLASRAAVFSAIFIALSMGVEESTLANFAACVATGFTNTPTENAAIVLRNNLIRERAGGRAACERMFRVSLRAINDFNNGIARKRNYYQGVEKLPWYDAFKEEVMKNYL